MDHHRPRPLRTQPGNPKRLRRPMPPRFLRVKGLQRRIRPDSAEADQSQTGRAQPRPLRRRLSKRLQVPRTQKPLAPLQAGLLRNVPPPSTLGLLPPAVLHRTLEWSKRTPTSRMRSTGLRGVASEDLMCKRNCGHADFSIDTYANLVKGGAITEPNPFAVERSHAFNVFQAI